MIQGGIGVGIGAWSGFVYFDGRSSSEGVLAFGRRDARRVYTPEAGGGLSLIGSGAGSGFLLRSEKSSGVLK